MDWVISTPNGRHFRMPARIREDEAEQFRRDVLVFRDGLISILDERLDALTKRYDLLVSRRKSDIEKIQTEVRLGRMDEFSEYFWTLLAETFYDEIKYVREWLRYWIKIKEILDNNTLLRTLPRDGDVTEEMVAHAKEKPLEELFEGQLRQTGDRFFGCCPFHDETTPSFVIYTKDNSYFCYGCQEFGDSIAFLMKLKKLSFLDAVKELQ